MAEVVVLECPQCGAPIKQGSNICGSCFSEYMVKSVSKLKEMGSSAVDKYLSAYRKTLASSGDGAEVHFSMGLCYMEKKLYDFAIKSFEKAVSFLPDDGDIFFYAAISILKGRKAFLVNRQEIDKIEEYLQAAMMLENKGIYNYFLAYIKYDYFYRKSFRTTPNYSECLANAKANGVGSDEISLLYETLGVDRPTCL